MANAFGKRILIQAPDKKQPDFTLTGVRLICDLTE